MKNWKIFILLLSISSIFSQDITLELVNLDSTDGDYSIEVQMSSNVDIAGFQFQVTGGILGGGNGGLATDNLSTITTNPNGMVLAFDFSGNSIPASDGILLNIFFSELTASEICIENPIFTSTASEEYVTDSGACISTGQSASTASINILEPQDGSTLFSNNVTINLLTTDPNNIGYHYHLFLDEINIGMFYDNYFNLEDISWGEHSLTVILADSSHIECADESCSQTVNFTLQEPSPEIIELTITDIDPVTRSFIIHTNNSAPFNSFDFVIEGVQPMEITSSTLDENGFAYSIANNSINGVSITSSFPAGESNFSTITYDNPLETEICIRNASFIDINGLEMIVTTNCADIIMPVNEFYLTELPQTGLNQLIHLSLDVAGLEPVDEIGIFDQSGITISGANCDNIVEGEVLVGAGLMLYDEISILSTGSVDMCGFGGFITSGFNLGNLISIKVYRPSEQIEYHAENIMFSNGSGTFNELFTEIISLTLVSELTNNIPIAIIDQDQIETFRNTDITLDGSSSTDSDGNIISFNWYLNGEELIGSEQILTHQFSAFGDYMITLVVTDNENAIGSAISVVNVINQLPTTISLITPSNEANLVILSEDEFDNAVVSFTWDQSYDLDNDELNYTLNLWKSSAPVEHNIEVELVEPFFSANYNSEYFNLEFNIDEEYSWNVMVSDGYDEIVSETSTFVFHFGTENMNEDIPFQFSLLQNYPNPFNPNTQIQFSLDKSEHIYLDLFDISGRHIIQLLNGKQNIGNKTINWNATDKNGVAVPAGIYIYKLNSKSNGAVQRTMTLLK